MKYHRTSLRNASRTSRLVEQLESRCLLSAEVVSQIPAQFFTLGQNPATLDVGSFFTDSAIPAGDTFVDIQTNLASPHNNIPLILTNAATPQTVANFLHYISSGEYANIIIHRSVPGFVIQGGGYSANGTAITTFGTIPGEAATATLKNTTGTIAMALTSAGPNSGTSQWFFNLQANPGLDDTSDGGPFTAFGETIDGGLSTLDAIANLPIVNDTANSAWNTIPVLSGTNGATVASEPASNLVTLNPVVVSGDGLTYSVSSSNTHILTASISNGTLSFSPIAAGTANITLTATDLGGGTTSSTFAVQIAGQPGVSSAAPTFGKSTLPATVIAGQPIKSATVTIDVTNDTGSTVKGPVTADLYASSNGTLGKAIFLTSVKTKSLTLKAGQTLPIAVPVKSLPASLTTGTYTLITQTIDALNTLSSVATGPTLTVAAPFISLSETITKLKVPATAAVGTKTSVACTFSLVNHGNISSIGLTTISLFLSPDGLADDETLITTTVLKKLTVTTTKPLAVSVPLKAFPAVAPGVYSVLAQVTDPDGTITTTTFSTPITLIAAPVKGQKALLKSPFLF